MDEFPEDILKKYWGFDHFRGSQKKIIASLLDGHDVLALMPTGGGKSICFQVPALINQGICIVVSPLVALIQDQVEALRQKGIKAIALTGGISPYHLDILLDNCIYGNYKFVYLSPERLQQPLVKERIQQMPVGLIAIDEAHCISEWGHDFRPTYRQCSLLKELHPTIPTIALTATATGKVAEDILMSLNIPNARRYRDSFERKNIVFRVENRQDKNYGVRKALENNKKSAIIYVRSRKDTVLLSRYLNQNKTVSTHFHGGLTNFEKKERLRAWLDDQVKIMVATNAFGMGVDKADVETVVHYQVPNSIENYFQEAGRAGRNGEPAKAILIINQNDIARSKKQFLDVLPDISFTKELYKKLNTFFQIAYNEGTDENYHFNLDTFCARYGLHPGKTYSTLKLLDQNGVISLIETSKEMETIQLICRKEGLFKWMGQNAEMGHIVQVLLRTYGGLFDFETKINLSLLSKKTNKTQPFIHETLKKLEKDGLAVYKSTQHDLTITFLKPREDEKTINPVVPTIDQLNRTKKEKLQSMLDYANNSKSCRAVALLKYFGEKDALPCGKCDVCQGKKANYNGKGAIKEVIIDMISSGPKTSRELVGLIHHDERYVLESLRGLLEDGELKLNADNTYDIK
ncbi:MAG: RecQ family ATP-dependent DNA helicase [Bacteroidota bacterium]